MKFILSSFVFISVSSAIACPDISGVFDCRGQPVEISKHNEGYNFIEQGQTKFIPTDSKPYSVDETTSYTAFCQEKTFHIRVNTANEDVGPITIETAYFIDSNNNLGIIGGLKYKIEGEEKVFPYASICQRTK